MATGSEVISVGMVKIDRWREECWWRPREVLRIMRLKEYVHVTGGMHIGMLASTSVAPVYQHV